MTESATALAAAARLAEQMDAKQTQVTRLQEEGMHALHCSFPSFGFCFRVVVRFVRSFCSFVLHEEDDVVVVVVVACCRVFACLLFPVLVWSASLSPLSWLLV